MERIKPYNKNTFAIYGGVDTNLFHPIVKPEYPFLTIGYAGNSRVWQGLPFLVETFLSAKLDQQGFKLQLLLSEEFSLPQGFRSVKVIDGVPPEDVPHILAKCDMLVIPREQNEVNRLSFPSKLMEYMAMGIPVVASKTSDMYKIVTDEVTGLLFEPGDAEALVASFLRLKDIQLRKRIGASARALVTEKYTWEYQANIMFDLLKNI